MYQRFKIRFSIQRNKEKFNFFNNRYLFYSLFLDTIRISNENISKKIHNGEIKRAFLFSNLFYNKKINPKFLPSRFHIYITSAYKEVASSLINGFEKKKLFNVNGSLIFLEDIVMETFDTLDSLTLISPIVVRNKDGKPFEEYNKNKFEEKLEEYFNRLASSLNINEKINISIEGNLRKKLFKIKNTYVRAWEFIDKNSSIEIKGSRLAKQLLLYYGLGDKTNLGFGMLGVNHGVR